MKIYEVGGAVRDALLGEPVGERDWVVVGASAEELEKLGFVRVGRDFPVFLHPETKEEYALARTERKIAPGHTGFAFDVASAVTLEEDLARRDLTINAMARDDSGAIIDPYGGRADLESRVLRHVSPAFREDPLRVLRVARFAASLGPLGFQIAPETLELMRRIGEDGELETLPAERVWQETAKALVSSRPDLYFDALRRAGTLAHVFPEVERLFGVPQPERWHPEIDTGVHTLMALRLAARLSKALEVRFAVLVHDLGKGTTPAEILPSHHGHEARSVELVEALCARLRVPKACERLAVAVARYHGLSHRAERLRSAKIHDLLEAVGALRDRCRLEGFLLACEADARGRKGLEETTYAQAEFLRGALEAALAVKGAEVAGRGLEGAAFGAALREERIAAIDRFRADGAVT